MRRCLAEHHLTTLLSPVFHSEKLATLLDKFSVNILVEPSSTLNETPWSELSQCFDIATGFIFRKSWTKILDLKRGRHWRIKMQSKNEGVLNCLCLWNKQAQALHLVWKTAHFKMIHQCSKSFNVWRLQMTLPRERNVQPRKTLKSI